jgi:acetyl-CoA carboxylase biotin carboxyl carrier protein
LQERAVPNNKKPARQPFGVELVKQLAEVMDEHDLSEVCFDTETGRVRIRRGALVQSAPIAAHAPAPAAMSAKSEAKAEPAKPSKQLLEIKSEALGTFYSRANPESEPYVKVGTRVTPTTVVGLIEAMKMFNEITAGVSGTVAEILIENQQPVEYGTVMFKVDPS